VLVGPQTANVFAMEHDNSTGVLWALNNDTREVGTINKTTGAFTATATISGIPAGETLSGLTFQTGSSTFYVSGTTGTVSNLYTLNGATGAATLVGAMGTALVIDIAINDSGQMYSHDIGTDSIYSVNTATGAATLIGATGVNANFAQGMESDKTANVLYAWLYMGAGVNQFATTNTATGAATTVVTPPNGEYEGAITPVELDSFSIQ
jgi:hypothetical protein